MQSKGAAPISAWSGFATGMRIVFCAILPVAGIGAELGTRMLEEMLTMFPNRAFEVAAVAGTLVNCALHAPIWRTAAVQPLRAMAFGCALGMALLYALVELPATPLMVMLAFIGLGLLAMAPYFTLLGLLALLRPLLRDWDAAGRPRSALVACVLIGPLAVAGWVGAHHLGRTSAAAAMERLHAALVAADPVAVSAAAAAVRNGDALALDALCSGYDPDDGFTLVGEVRRGTFWFLGRQRDGGPVISPEDARTAWYYAFGTPWRPEPARTGQWRGSARWQESNFDAVVELPAAIARVDWVAEVRGTGSIDTTASFEIDLPPDAVASSLSLWIDGIERPAAFAAEGQAKAAFDRVVAKTRDPALLRETAPGRLQLQLFPLSSRRSPMRVRVGVTVPLLLRADGAWLQLPSIAATTCENTITRHRIAIADGEHRQDFVGTPGSGFWFPAPAARVAAQDAGGVVLQTIVDRPVAAPEPTVVLVVEASHSAAVASPEPAAALAAFPAGTRAIVFVARAVDYVRVSGAVDSPDLHAAIAAVPRAGGVDPQRALLAALAEAERIGAARVWFVHGDSPQPPRPRVARPGLEVAAFALAPGMRSFDEGDGVFAVRMRRVPSAASDLAERLRDLAAFVAHDGEPRERRFERVTAMPPKATVVSDQVARLWAGGEARSLAVDDRSAALALATRYRLVTTGAAAVVLENPADYAAFDLRPGAEIGREPDGPIGGPAPEPSTCILLASGLAMAWILRRRRVRAV